MSDEILRLEVAALLKVADKTVYTMAQQGDLPAFNVHGQRRFRRQDLDSWMAPPVQGEPERPAAKSKAPTRKATRR